jgi:hypothetical protein
MATSSLFRYYRPTAENFEALQEPYLYLFNAIEFKGASEMQFDINISNPAELKEYIRTEIQKTKDIPKDSPEFEKYSNLRYHLLNQHGKRDAIALGTDVEHLTEIIYEDIMKDKKIGTRKGLIRNNIFKRTGVASFTTDPNSLYGEEHWFPFALNGTGFCVEYDWSVLRDHFAHKKEGIKGDKVKYYNKPAAPTIILSNSYSDTVMDNYCEIIFSLKQTMANEREFRLAKVFAEDLMDPDERRKVRIPTYAIKAVYAGPRIKEPDLQKLKNVVTGMNPTPTLYLMKDAGGTFVPLPAS